jgi:hypothetical protein
MPKLLLCGLAVLALLAAGCSDDDDPTTPPPTGYPDADTPDQLMQNFMDSQEDRDLDEYGKCLDADFRFHLQQATIDEFLLPAAFFTRVQDVAITEQLFSDDPAGGAAAIESIEFVLFTMIEDEWVDISGGPLPGELSASFDVSLRYTETGDESGRIIEVRGRITVAVVSEQVEENGGTETLYRIVSIEDETGAGGKGVEDVIWGSLKASYIPDLVID